VKMANKREKVCVLQGGNQITTSQKEKIGTQGLFFHKNVFILVGAMESLKFLTFNCSVMVMCAIFFLS